VSSHIARVGAFGCLASGMDLSDPDERGARRGRGWVDHHYGTASGEVEPAPDVR
jgi:hypothetical protein